MGYLEKELDLKNIPYHIAIIMDGNRRWAKKRFLPAAAGHKEGAECLDRTIRAASDLGVKVLTVYVFSTENWSRSKEEIDDIMKLLEKYLINKRDEMVKEGVRLDAIGDLSQCSKGVQKEFLKTYEATKNGTKISLVLAINYGSRDEIRRTFLKILDDCDKQIIKKEMITEELISKYLDTKSYPDPDLLIRTSGERRISNYLLWQMAYTELYLSEALWPDFSKKHLLEAILDFQKRKRRKGL